MNSFIRTNRSVKSATAAILLITTFLTSAISMGAELPARGTIQSLQQDGGIIRISGRDFHFSDNIVLVTLDDKEVGSQYLSEGMIVRYTVNAQGFLETIEILGPRNLVTEIKES